MQAVELSRDEDMRERFERETAGHEMRVLRDDGLYRHLRFQAPGDSSYWYDLVTWPGCLAIVGDCDDYVFARIPDMFEFFAGARQAKGINPDYWSQKLRGRIPGRSGARSYSEDRFRAQVLEWFADETRDILGIEDWRFTPTGEWLASSWFAAPYVCSYEDGDTDPDERLRQLEEAIGLLDALDDQILAGWHETHDEDAARRLLADFEHNGRRLHDTWEWDFHDYDWTFLWCCWAIVKGIEQYRAAAPAPSTREDDGR